MKNERAKKQRSFAKTLLALLIISGGLSGCDVLGGLVKQPVEFPAGANVVVAKPAKVTVWITNDKTGNREMQTVEVWPDYVIVNPERKDYSKE